MLGLILLYFVGKEFYKLATKFKKEGTWKFVVLGTASYYGGMLIGVFLFTIIAMIGFEYDVEEMNDALLGLMGVPVGIGLCYTLYKTLEKKWKSEVESSDMDWDRIDTGNTE